jgi:hypothetical protein
MKRFITLLLCLAVFLPGKAGAQDLAVSTNVLDYARLGTLNLEASLGLARHWTLNAGARYNPFSYEKGGGSGEQMQLRQRSLSLGTRFWPWHIHSGWWLSAKLQAQEYNEGGLRSQETEEGERYGGGLGAGYTYMLHKHLNLEVGASLWAGTNRFTVYACPVCGKITGGGDRTFVRPNEILLSLIYVF